MGSMDTNDDAMEGKCLVKYITQERQPFGPNGPKWRVFHVFLALTVLKLDLNDMEGSVSTDEDGKCSFALDGAAAKL